MHSVVNKATYFVNFPVIHLSRFRYKHIGHDVDIS